MVLRPFAGDQPRAVLGTGLGMLRAKHASHPIPNARFDQRQVGDRHLFKADTVAKLD